MTVLLIGFIISMFLACIVIVLVMAWREIRADRAAHLESGQAREAVVSAMERAKR